MDEKFDDFPIFDDEEFGPVVKDNLAEMNACEKAFNAGEKSLIESSLNFTTVTGKAKEVDVTQYFSKNTSRLGSLEYSISNPPPDHERPNLGLEKINSPERKPAVILEDEKNSSLNELGMISHKVSLK